MDLTPEHCQPESYCAASDYKILGSYKKDKKAAIVKCL